MKLPPPKKRGTDIHKAAEELVAKLASTDKFQYPSTIGECIDKLYAMREERLTQEKEVEKLKAAEESMKKYILTTFGDANLDGARGRVATASVSPDILVRIENWEVFTKYVQETGEFDLLERRPGKLAYKARLEEGISIPGLMHFPIVKLNLVKSTRK